MIGAFKALACFLICFGTCWVSVYWGGVTLGMIPADKGEPQFFAAILSVVVAGIITVETGAKGVFK